MNRKDRVNLIRYLQSSNTCRSCRASDLINNSNNFYCEVWDRDTYKDKEFNVPDLLSMCRTRNKDNFYYSNGFWELVRSIVPSIRHLILSFILKWDYDRYSLLHRGYSQLFHAVVNYMIYKIFYSLFLVVLSIYYYIKKVVLAIIEFISRFVRFCVKLPKEIVNWYKWWVINFKYVLTDPMSYPLYVVIFTYLVFALLVVLFCLFLMYLVFNTSNIQGTSGVQPLDTVHTLL